MQGIVWIASYPKSGNTWTRAFLTSYFESLTGRKDHDRNLLARLLAPPLADSRAYFDELVGLPSAELSEAQLERYRPLFHALLYDALKDATAGPVLMKTHYRFRSKSGRPQFLAPSSAGAIILIRNPLDIVSSYASHSGVPTDEMIELMAKKDMMVGSHRYGGEIEIPQQVGSWSEHVSAWSDCDAFPTLIVRYEDLLAEPVAQFTAMLEFLGMSPVAKQVAFAVEATRFEALRHDEDANGFMKMPRPDDRFFRKGIRDDWRTTLTQDQARRVVADHAAVMERFGYLDPAQEWLTARA